MNMWYGNAQDLESNADVVLGQPLSEDVQATLTEDVLWMELVEVDGNQVMVPRLYLSQATKDRLEADGQGPSVFADVVALEDTSLNLESGLFNSNTIHGSASSITNGEDSKIKSAVFNVTSKGDVTNSGSIESSELLSVTTTEGDIKVDGSLKSGGMLNLDSTGNITVTAGHIESGGSAYLFAKNNLEFLADEDPLGMNNVVSTLTVGGNLFTDSGGDTTLQATDVSVAELAYIKTGGDLNLTTVTDKSDYTEVIEDGNTTTVRRVTEEKERGVNLTVGDNLFIESGSDLNMTAANLDVEGAASISAINDVNIMAGKHTKVTEEEVTTTEKD